MRIALIGGVSALALTTAALAVNSGIPSILDIESFATGTAPDSVTKKSASALETQSAIVGSNYAVINGAVDGTAGGALNSYLRLFNGGALAANISVTVVNSANGVSLGTTSYSIPPMASKQYIMSDVVHAVSPTAAAGGTYTLYLSSAESTAGYQHVTFNGITFLYENASVCKNLLSQVTSPSGSLVLVNIHTSIIAAFGYPMSVTLHNFADTAKTYTAKIYNAETGTLKGQISIPAAANTSYSFLFTTQMQQAAGVSWTPVTGENFANVVITDSTGAVNPNAMIGSSIDTSSKLGTGASSNMSTVCAINAAASSSSGGGGGGFGDGGTTY